MLKNCSLYGDTSQNSIFHRIGAVANESYRKICRESKDLEDDCEYQRTMRVLNDLKEDSNIHITRPDKGKGVVIMNKTDYDQKMMEILADTSKFRILKTEIASHILKLEDKLNRILRGLKGTIGEFVYSELYSSGSRPGYIYGLPKIHKPNIPLRPIISSIGTFNYNLAKFLVRILKPLTSNEFNILNSASFIRDLCLRPSNHVVMASFDVVSLFTNIPWGGYG